MERLRALFNKLKDVNRKKLGMYIGVGIAVFVMGWAFISAGIISSSFNREQISGSKDEQRVDAVGVIITETKDGNKYFEIYGETGNYSNDRSIATLNNVVGNFYKDGEVSMSFQSSKGTYNEKEGSITLYENTYIVLKDETSLAADKLTWLGNDNETVAEGNVKIRKGKELLATADKCIIGVGYEKFKITGKTQTKLFSDKGV
ncbi:MAG: LPS export ABC transporter periplasmic protein LptC [Candidatus Gastranaerophilales bacterium]|nr:LPS export ABC transporter periplasmic protein LptC [Candidatus Gastranaerophilales bacterium]